MKILRLLFLFLLITNLCAAKPLTSEVDLVHGRIGIWPGTRIEQYIKLKYPEAEYIYLDSLADMAENLRQGRIDAFVLNRIFVNELFSHEQNGMEVLEEFTGKTRYSFAISFYSETIYHEFNDFLKTRKETGGLKALQQEWLEGGDENRSFDPVPLSGENGTISVAVNPFCPPLLYSKNGKMTGYSMELLYQFAEEYKYDIKLDSTSFDLAIAGVENGVYDISISTLEYMPESADHFFISDAICEADNVIVVRSDMNMPDGVLQGWKKKLQMTLLQDDHWRMLANGLLTTIRITIVSVVAGTLLGLLLSAVYHLKKRKLNLLIDICSYLTQGVPMLVVLMVFYYIIFKDMNISGSVIASITFSLLFGIFFFEMLKDSVNHIPIEQKEAALALGYSEWQAYLKFILPQCIHMVFPNYRSKAIELMQSTSIVGYIAVQDLTQVADIIRSRIFDAYAPLVIITIVYLALVYLIQECLNALFRKFDYRNRKQNDILKGVKL